MPNQVSQGDRERTREILMTGYNDPSILNNAYADALNREIITQEELENMPMRPERIEEILRLSTNPPPVYGCTDPNATNYDPQATIDDDSCDYEPDSNYIIEGEVKDENGVPIEGAEIKYVVLEKPFTVNSNEGGVYRFEILGNQSGQTIQVTCSKEAYSDHMLDIELDTEQTIQKNFTLQNSSPPPVYGCTDPNATNYDPQATIDDDSCDYEPDSNYIIEGEVKDENGVPIEGAEIKYVVLEKPFTVNSNEGGVYRFEILGNQSGQSIQVTCSKEEYSDHMLDIELDTELTIQKNFTLQNQDKPPQPGCEKFDDKSFEEIINGLIQGKNDKEDVKKCLNLNEEELTKAKRQYSSNPPIAWSNTIPTLAARSTDHWLLGISASGKSAMLASIINHFQKRLIMDPVSAQNIGVRYKSYLRHCMLNACMPQDTPTTAGDANSSTAIFAYMPFNLMVNDSYRTKPINLIEMAGEHVAGLKDNSTELRKLDWIRSPNEKILTLVFDLDNPSRDQAQDMMECLDLFQRQKGFKKIIKIFLVITKVDLLEEYGNGESSYDEVKAGIKARIENNEPALINTIKNIIRRNTKFGFKRKLIEFDILPMSISTELVKGKFIKKKDPRFIKEYAERMERGLIIR